MRTNAYPETAPRLFCAAASYFAGRFRGSMALPHGRSKIYFVDVEGGQATLIVSPSGQSLLIDTGWRGFDGRDADRIVQAAKAAKIKQIDYLLITHYHRDHVGGVPQLADRMKIVNFVDHGPNTEDSKVTKEDYTDYVKVIQRGEHRVLKPGDTVPIKDSRVKVLTAAGEHIQTPAGRRRDSRIRSALRRPRSDADPTENARSMGVLITFEKFRILDLGDLTWNKELELMCPNNPIGTVDVLLVSHHGLNQSNSPALVEAVHPRVAIMNNGARKGGSPDAWQIVKDSPGPGRPVATALRHGRRQGPQCGGFVHCQCRRALHGTIPQADSQRQRIVHGVEPAQ